MTTAVVHRDARHPAPDLPGGDVVLPAPPARPTPAGSRWTHLLMALPMLAGTIATALLFAGRDGGTYSYVVGGVFGLSSLGMLATSMSGGTARRTRVDTDAIRRDYLAALSTLRRQVRSTVREQRAAMIYRHPAPTELWSMVSSFRLWERRPGDADFGVVRIGTGPHDLSTPLVAPPPVEPADPSSATALRAFIETYAVVPDLPVALAVTGFARIEVDDLGLVRALIAQLTFAHAPTDLAIVGCVGPDRVDRWSYLKWLPHAWHPDRIDAAGPVRRIGHDARIFSEASGAHLVIIADGVEPADAPESGTTVVAVQPAVARPGALRLAVTADGRLLRESAEIGVADRLSLVEAEALARSMAPLRIDPVPTSRTSAAVTGRPIGLDDLLGFDRLGLDRPAIERLGVDGLGGDLGGGRSAADRLCVPIGRRPSGEPVLLDLKEAARDGMGPHGLLIGATGSGKSELLRTLVLALAATHSSADLNFVLIDFKGGATFGLLDRLPHTAAVITNLADELPLVDRMADALNGELVRRQEMLRRAGNLASLTDYERARGTDPGLAPLPVLLVVCDEFSELLSAKPEFIDLFVAIGRLGRSLGVHLLLASQRLDEGRLRGLDTHLSYRIGLRTFSAMESRAVLGRPDAYELPRMPGHGYLKFGTEPLVRFTAAYVSGPIERPDEPAPRGTAPWQVVPFDAVSTRIEPAVPGPTAAGPSLLDVLTAALHGSGPPAHPVWLAPLSTSDPIDSLLGAASGLRVPIGVVDRPFEQRRDPLVLDLTGSAGHVAIVGGPQSGKSGLIRALVAALALTRTPRETTFYCLDFGGGALAVLRDLPHVGGVTGRLAPDTVRRLVGDIAAVLTDRERRFAADGLDSIGTARERSGALDPYGDVFLVIDGWTTMRGEFEELEAAVTDIATRGLAYGIHVVITAGRWADLRPALRDLIGSRVELRLGEPAESLFSRRRAADVPARSPGRGLTSDGRHFLAAMARLSGASVGADTSAGTGVGLGVGSGSGSGSGSGTVDDLVKAVAAAWPGQSAPAVRELPALVPFESLPAPTGLALPLGIAESDLAPVLLDFAADPHLLIFGDGGSGKSSTLRCLATSIGRHFTPEQARIVMLDYRRSALGEVTGEHLIGYATSAAPAADLITSVAGYMRGRLPGPDTSPRELRARSWWTGPECFVLVDDLDLVTGSAGNPLAPLVDLLSQARDVGLHLVLARRTGGAGRALFEPTMARLRELATPGILLSGDRDEGPLAGGVRAKPLPPGRANLVTRAEGARMVQIGYVEPLDT